MDKRLKKMTAIFFLAAAADLFLAAVLLASLARQRAEGAAAPGTGRVVEDGGWDGLGTEEAGAVALTFDDGPSAHTARILDCLEANDARATFYMVGNRMGTYQSTVKRMVDMGCEPGSHTWDHTYITKLSQEGLFANLNRLDDTLQSIAGVRTVTMRPPGGFVSDNAKQNLAKKGVPAILWSIDTLDWKSQNSGKVLRSIERNAGKHQIVLMHDIFPTTVDAALAAIDTLTKQGYTFVTVDELLID